MINIIIIINSKGKEFSDKLKQGVPLDDLLTNYNKHRERTKPLREEQGKGWDELKYKFDQGYNPTNPYFLNKSYGDKYNQHNVEETISDIPYWDTKENDAYYSLSRWQRLKLYFKSKVNIIKNKDLIILNILILIFIYYYANKKSKQIII